jgi:hypothetical protein
MRIFATLAFAAVAGCDGLPRPTAGVPDANLQGIASSVAKATGIAIIHSSPNGTGGAWHVEDVVEFRRGPDGTFRLHTT